MAEKLFEALRENNLEHAELLLRHGIDPNEILQEQSISPMHLAAGLGIEPVCLLLQHGGDPNIRLADGTTPLHVATMWGDADCVQILLSNGGNPFIKDQDGLSAIDFGKQYKHSEVVEVIEKYMFLLATVEEATLTPKYTYTRRSVENESTKSLSSLDVTSSDMLDTFKLEQYLQDFTRRRRSSVYLRNVQKQIDKYFGEGQKTHIVDVTSPDHLYVEPKCSERSPSPEGKSPAGDKTEDSLHLHLSISENEESTCTDSFVTCDGEDMDTIIKMVLGKDPSIDETKSKNKEMPGTVIKQFTIERPQNAKMVGRNKKYCRRLPILPSVTDLFVEEEFRQCQYCGCEVKGASLDRENVCLSCHKLGLELEELSLETSNNSDGIKTNDNVHGDHDLIVPKLYDTDNYGQNGTVKWKTRDQYQSVNLERCKNQNYIKSENGDKETNLDLDLCSIQSVNSGDSIISEDASFIDRKIVKAEFHPSDLSTITISDSSQNCKSARDKNVEVNTDMGKQGKSSPGLDDLWSEVRASAMKVRKARDCKKILDTAFIGRESVNSAFSDASTVDYVYTDKEHGIILLERHLPSQCGSSGSRRSLESLFSIENSPQGGKQSLDGSINSQDTISYDWKEHAMIKVSDDSGNGDSLQNSEPLSQELLKLDNKEIRSKLCQYWDDPGPVTPSTRQAYLRRLSQLQIDPNAKWLTKKGPEYPPELNLALNGKLDLTDCSDIEAKMVEAFQNPNRLRRWREGTLKSSFNYVLLDPRITDNLPNRALNMNDLDIFRTFISAIFYIGKGKRARPYCHLYEAIKHMKKPNGKASRKVQQILDIWSCDMGVVSLHCFQSVIPVEAYTREACMVEAMGLKNLTNMKRGDYYGVSTTYSMKQRRRVGVYLLTKALQIFLAEGERQISPLDIKNDA